MNSLIFPILAFEHSEITKRMEFNSGTGFLIDDNGYLFTAGHNFYLSDPNTRKLKELTCFAFINNELIEIEKVYIEYDKNAENEKKDFAIGKLKSLPARLTPNVSVSNEDYLMFGYSKRNLPFEIIETVSYENSSFYLFKVPINPTGNVLKFNSIEIRYNNVLFFDCSSKVDFSGLSGCPILKMDKVCGMLVSNCFIKNDYMEKIFNNVEINKTST